MKKKLKKKKIEKKESAFRKAAPYIPAVIVGGLLIGALSQCEVKKVPLRHTQTIAPKIVEETTASIQPKRPVAKAVQAKPVRHIHKKKHRIVNKKHNRKHYSHKPCNCICMPRIFVQG